MSPYQTPEVCARREAILDAYVKGEKLREIGERFNIRAGRVSAIARAHNLPRRNRGRRFGTEAQLRDSAIDMLIALQRIAKNADNTRVDAHAFRASTREVAKDAIALAKGIKP